MRRNAWSVAAALIGTLLSGGRAEGQAAGERPEPAAAWRSALPADSIQLGFLFHETLRQGGDALLREVLAAAADRSAPPLARVHAVAALHKWMHPSSGSALGYFLRAAREAYRSCPSAGPWRAGETLRICQVPHPVLEHHGFGSPDQGRPPLDPASPLGREVRATAVCIARDDPSRPVQGAADLLLSDMGWSQNHAVRCPAPTPAPATGRWRSADSLGLFTLREVTEPPTFRSPGEAYRTLARGVAPGDDRGGAVRLALRVDREGLPRDVMILHGSGSPELDDRVRRSVERLRFAPARIGEVAVAVRMELTVEGTFGSPYPRVPAP